MKCRSCGKETPATLCNICFLDEVISAVEMGEDDPSRILKGMAAKYGRLRNLKRLPVYRTIFGSHKLRRVITTEEGERCRLVPTYDGWVAVSTGYPDEYQPGLPGITTKLPGQSTEGGRIVTYYKGDTPVKEIHYPTALVIRRQKGRKRAKYITSGPPPRHYKSPIRHERPPSFLDK